MKTRRLNHLADTLPRMVCGWRLIGSKPALVELGSGELEIDLLTGEARHEGSPLERLDIARELHLWLDGELERLELPRAHLTRARLLVRLELDRVPWQETGERFFASDGQPVRTDWMHRCAMRSTCELETADGRVRSGSHSETELWPEGWPAE